MKKIAYIEIIADNHRSFGLQLGSGLSEQIKARLMANKLIYKRLGVKSFELMIQTAKKFVPAIKKHFPRYLAEARAIARGAGVPFEELMVMICEEELLDIKLPHCTSMAVKNGQQILIGHNEDWLSDYLDNGLVVIKGEIADKKFLTLSYIGGLPGSSCGVNSDKIAFTGNSLNAKRFRYGVPKTFHTRALLEATTFKQAVKMDLVDETIATNTMVVWDNTKMMDMEIYFMHHDDFDGTNYLIHTNHPILAKERNENNTDMESVKRYERMETLLRSKTHYTVSDVKEVLADHHSGICGHFSGKKSTHGVTIASVIMNPHLGWMEVAWGCPCENKYRRYFL
jgi:hypothetical protein